MEKEPKYKPESSKSFTLRVPLDVSDPLEQMSEDSGITRNRLIVSAIREMLTKNKYIIK
jgi:predicted HicB family RNase H-like nuclease